MNGRLKRSFPLLVAALAMTLLLSLGMAFASETVILEGDNGYITEAIENAPAGAKLSVEVEYADDSMNCYAGWGIGGICTDGTWNPSIFAYADEDPTLGYRQTVLFDVDEIKADGDGEYMVNIYNGFQVVKVTLVTGAKDYTISYVMNGGTNNPFNPTKYNKYSDAIYLKNPSKEGCIFSGWYTDAALTKRSSGIASGSTGNRTFYAKFTDGTGTTRKLTFDADGGTGTVPSAITAAGGASVTIPSASLKKEGYYFMGWSLAQGQSTAQYKSKSTIVLSTNTTLYAVWKQIEYHSLSMNPNGGDGDNWITFVPKGTSVTIPKLNVSKNGYYFMGWGENPEGSATYKTGDVIRLDRDYILHAIWKPSTAEYRLVYDINGGYGDYPGPDRYLKGTEAYVPKVSVFRDDFYFLGWATSATAKTAEYKSGSRITMTKNLTLYAVWKYALPMPKLVFSVNGGTGTAPKSLSAVPGDLVVVPKASLSRENYYFLGWSTSATAQSAMYKSGDEVVLYEDTTLYAVWKCKYKECTVVFDANGGSGKTPDDLKLFSGIAGTIPKASLSRTGFYFLGWSTDKAATAAQYTSGKSITVTSNRVLYAVWKASGPILSFDLNEGVGTVPASMSGKSGTALTIPKASVSRKGFYFLGWSTSKSATSAQYTSGKTISITKNTTLYAVWKKKPAKTWDLGGQTITIGDWWSGEGFDYWDTYFSSSDEQEEYKQYQLSMMEEHNYTLTRKSVYGWGDEAEVGLLSILSNEPVADIMIFDCRFVGTFFAQEEPLFCDVSQCEAFDFSDEKWNKAVVDMMTVNGKIYGFSTDNEARTGVFFNKDLYAQFRGADKVDELYDLQAAGNWTWAKFEEIAQSLTRDTDNDGEIDVYGFAAQQSVLFEMAVISNGHEFVTKDSLGRLVSQVTSQDVIDDCNWAYSLYTNNYTRRGIEGEQWNYFDGMFVSGEAAMVVYDEYKAVEFLSTCNFDFGFVCFPRGPKANKYYSIVRENVYVIPNCPATKDRVEEIAYAFNVYTDKAPNASTDADAWKADYEYCFSDTRAVNETIDLMLHRSTQVMPAAYIVPGLMDNANGFLQSHILYCIDDPDRTPAEVLASQADAIAECIADFNAKMK